MIGCEYCKSEGKNYSIKPCGNGDLGARAQFLNGGIVLYVNRHEASGYFDIKFCPMCGRKQKEANDG